MGKVGCTARGARRIAHPAVARLRSRGQPAVRAEEDGPPPVLGQTSTGLELCSLFNLRHLEAFPEDAVRGEEGSSLVHFHSRRHSVIHTHTHAHTCTNTHTRHPSQAHTDAHIHTHTHAHPCAHAHTDSCCPIGMITFILPGKVATWADCTKVFTLCWALGRTG